MSNDLLSFIKSYKLNIHFKNSELLGMTSIQSKIRNYSFPYRILFSKFKYSIPFIQDSDQPQLVAKLLLLIQDASTDLSFLKFIIAICIKLVNEHIILKEHTNTINDFLFFASHCSINDNINYIFNSNYFNQYIHMMVKTLNQSSFDNLRLQSTENRLMLETRLDLLSSDYLIDMLCFDNSCEFISSIIKWNYNQWTLNKLIIQLTSLFFGKKFICLNSIILKQMCLLSLIKSTEQSDLLNNPNKLMCGIGIVNGFHLKSSIFFPNENYKIEFTFIINDDYQGRKQPIISFSSQSWDIIMSFYVHNSKLFLYYYNNSIQISEVEYGKTIHISFQQTLPSYFPLRKNRCDVYINQSQTPITVYPSEYLKGNINMKIGSFKGEIGKITIFKQGKSTMDGDIELLIDPYVLLSQFQQKKEFKLVQTISPNILIKNKTREGVNDAYDRPFEYIPFKESFTDNEGISYLLLIMHYLNSSVKGPLKESNIVNCTQVYDCIKAILEFVFEMYKESIKNWKEPLFALFYSVSLLINQLVIKEKIPKNLIQFLYDQLPTITNQHLKNNLLMILINPENITKDDLNIFLSNWSNFLDKADRYTTKYMIQSLLFFYQQDDTPKKGICILLRKILIKSKSDIKVFYLDKALQIPNTKHLYKLLKVYYLSLPQIFKEQLGTISIYNTLSFIYDDHSVSKDKYSILLQALIIRLLDELFIRFELRNSKGFIHQSNVESSEGTTDPSNYSIYNRMDRIINKSHINLLCVRSIFLISFQLTSQIDNINFIKSKVDLRVLTYGNINSKATVATVFKVIYRLKKKTPMFDEYNLVLHGFINEILLKIKDKNNQKHNEIFESQKILGDIFINIIQSKAYTREEIIADFNSIIEKSFIYHSNPFYFNFIYRLASIDEQALYIEPLLLQMINYKYEFLQNSSCPSVYLSNNKNLIILLYKLFFFSSIDKKILFTFLNEYIKMKKGNPLIYTRLLYEIILPNQKLFLIEILIEMLIEYYIDNQDIECDLLKSLIIFQNEKNESNTIFYYIDIWESKNKDMDYYQFVSDIMDYEEMILDNTGVRSPYLLLNYFAIKICNMLQRESVSQSNLLFNFLKDLLRIISNDLNKYNEIINLNKNSQFQIEVNDAVYLQFKSKLKNIFRNKQKVSPEIIKAIYNEQLSQTTRTYPQNQDCDINENNKVQPSIIPKSEVVKSETLSATKNATDTNSSIILDKNYEENQLSRWFKLIQVKGIKLVHKSKVDLMKGSLAIFFKRYFFFNEQFSSTVLDCFNNFTNYCNDNRIFLSYPTKIKNYTTDNYIRPFLSIDRFFFNDTSLKISHSYLNMNTIESSIINDHKKCPLEFKSIFQIDCELIKADGVYYSSLHKYKKILIIETKKYNSINNKYPLCSYEYIYKPMQVIIPFLEIKEVILRRFLFQFQAIELFLFNGKSYFINLFNKEGVESLLQLLQRVQLKNEYQYQLITNPKSAFMNGKYPNKWKNYQISTFDYLLMINKYSGRSYNDLNQYPVFPWILSSYKELIQKDYRKFEYPMSIQAKDKRILALSNYENVQSCFEEYFQIPCHFYSHYSTNAFVYYFLNRLKPFTKLNIHFQSGKLDNPNRQFHSLNQTIKIIESLNGNRELIPELFFLPELFLNLNYSFFGRKDSNKLINNVILPSNCLNEEEMIFLHKEILNSNEIGKLITKWIDNIFGINQLIQKKESLNVFPGHSYEQIINKKNLIDEDIDQIKPFILNLGQTPMQLFTSTHLTREIKDDHNLQKPKSFLNNSVIFSGLLSPENMQKSINSIKYIKTGINDVKCVSYLENHIIAVSSKKISIFDKKKFTINQVIPLGHSFLFMNKNFIVQFDNCSYLICGNFYDKSFKIFQKQKQKLVHTEFTNSFVMTFGIGVNDEKSMIFYTGTIKGVIAKWVFNPKQKNFVSKENELIAHQGAVLCIIISEYLNAIITSGDDCYIYIRNSYSYEVLSCIEIGYIPREIMLFDSMIIFAFGTQASGYTLNGVRFTYINEEYRNPQLVDNILYLTSNNQILVKLNPFDFTQERLHFNLTSQIKDQIVYVYINTEEKAIDCFMENIEMKRIFFIKKVYEIGVESTIDNYIFYPDF